jgi:hypothetical protein
LAENALDVIAVSLLVALSGVIHTATRCRTSVASVAVH